MHAAALAIKKAMAKALLRFMRMSLFGDGLVRR